MTALERTRLERRLTVAALAEASGVSSATIRRAEREGTRLSDATLFALADVLRVEPLDLREPEPTPEVA